MAKRRKKTAVRRRRRASVGKVDVSNLIATVVGGVGAKLVNKILPATIDPKLASGAKVVVGVALPMIAKNAKTKNMFSAVGTGMALVGTMELLSQFGVVNGVDDILEVQLNGDDLNVLNGDDISVLNDDDTEDAEYMFTDEDDILDQQM